MDSALPIAAYNWAMAFHPPPLLFLLLVIPVAFALRALQKGVSRDRAAALQAEALKLGFSFEGDRDLAPLLKATLLGPGHPPTNDAPMLTTALFTEGDERSKFANVMTGNRDGVRVNLFDYTLVGLAPQGNRPFQQTVAAFSKAGICLPEFRIRPVETADKIWDAVTREKSKVETDPEFSRRYILYGALDDRASDDKLQSLFTPPLRTFLKSLDPRETWTIEGIADTLVLYTFSTLIPPSEIGAFFDRAAWIANNFLNLVGSTAPKN